MTLFLQNGVPCKFDSYTYESNLPGAPFCKKVSYFFYFDTSLCKNYPLEKSVTDFPVTDLKIPVTKWFQYWFSMFGSAPKRGLKNSFWINLINYLVFENPFLEHFQISKNKSETIF